MSPSTEHIGALEETNMARPEITGRAPAEVSQSRKRMPRNRGPPSLRVQNSGVLRRPPESREPITTT